MRRLFDSGWTYATAWLLTRSFAAFVFRYRADFITGDVDYYFRKVSELPDVGMAATMPEYPVPVVWLLQLLRAVSGDDFAFFTWGFVGSMLVLDAGFTWLLWRQGGRFRGLATGVWVVFLACIGPLAYCRFDLAPAVLAGTAALWSMRRPTAAGTLIGLGAALKLWPALLVIPLLARRTRAKALVGLGLTGFLLAALAYGSAGWDRLVSPLTWQSDRGLQVESIPATWIMFERATIDDVQWVIGLSKFNAFELWGPGVTETLQFAAWLQVGGLAAIAVLAVRAALDLRPSIVSVAITMLAIVVIMTVANKTLSPQYLIWLGGPLAAACSGLGAWAPGRRSRQEHWQIYLAALIALLIALLTQIVYPLTYRSLVDTQRGHFWPAMVLVGRNLVLFGFTFVIWGLAWQLTGSGRPARDVESGPQRRLA